MQSGDFNKSISIFIEETTTNAKGFESSVEKIIYRDRAKVSHIKSSEIMKNDIASYAPRKKLTIRKRVNIIIDTDMFIYLENQKYNIIDIDPDSHSLYTYIYIERMME